MNFLKHGIMAHSTQEMLKLDPILCLNSFMPENEMNRHEIGVFNF